MVDIVPYTDEQIFEKSARHLLTQMKRSVSNEACKYRGPDGLMCAAGPFISEEKYRPHLEGKRISSTLVLNSMPGVSEAQASDQNPYNRNRGGILTVLQNIHDNNPPEMWYGLLHLLGSERGFNVEWIDDDFSHRAPDLT